MVDVLIVHHMFLRCNLYRHSAFLSSNTFVVQVVSSLAQPAHGATEKQPQAQYQVEWQASTLAQQPEVLDIATQLSLLRLSWKVCNRLLTSSCSKWQHLHSRKCDASSDRPKTA